MINIRVITWKIIEYQYLTNEDTNTAASNENSNRNQHVMELQVGKQSLRRKKSMCKYMGH